MRTKDEEEQFKLLRDNLGVGFCLGGYIETRTPEAYAMSFEPLQGKPTPTKLSMVWSFWGAPNMIQRLIFGRDAKLRDDLLASGKWNGTPADLDTFLSQYQLATPLPLPIRDAIDFTHACIASTIKAMKFSSLPQICGGPIEIAVITTDRRFRWVLHKEWDAAIMEGAPA